MSAFEPPREGAEPPNFPAIIVRGDALERLENDLGADSTAESGGVLVGNAAPSTNFVLVTGSLPADPIDPSAANFTFGPAQLETLARQVAEVYPGQRVVGWYHSHPGTGIFLSAADVYLQRTYFAQPWHIGYVFDPVNADRGFFGWSNREIIRVPRWEVTTVDYASGADLPVSAPVEPGAGDDDDGDGDDDFGYGATDDVSFDESAGDTGAEGDLVPAGAPLTIGGDLDPPVAEPVSEPPRRPKSKALAAIVLGAVLAIVIIAIVLSSGDDDKNPTTTAPDDTTSVVATDPATVVTDPTSASTTDAVATTAATPGATTQPTTGSTGATAISIPPTPTAVSPPTARVAGAATAACEPVAASQYEPIANCFVPLVSGNIVVFVDGSLRCADPDGRAIAPEAQSFTIGAEGDPLAITAGEATVDKCIDLTYARNVMAGGAEVYDGLCGSSGTQINEATVRCFGHNGETGAMGAVVRGTADQTALVAACFGSGGAAADTTELDWSDADVTIKWVVESVAFDPTQDTFVATATRENETATANFTCA